MPEPVGLEGQLSSVGDIRTGDAAVAEVQLGIHPGEGGGLDDLKVLDRQTAEALVGMARVMYPHERLPDLHYERVIAALDVKAASDERMQTLLTEGAGFLATTTGRHPHEFASLDENAQMAALTRLEKTPFFQAIAAEVIVNLYSQPDVWPYFGYEGPSNDKGGYVNRGFDDIDWLDDAPDRRGNAVVERVDTEERISREA